jgi:O-antigen/teichoic acid export membrane protein
MHRDVVVSDVFSPKFRLFYSNQLHHFLRRISWFAAAPIVVAAVSFLSLPMLTRYLSASHYGLFALGMSIGSLIPAIANPGALSFLSPRLFRSTSVPGVLLGTLLACSVIAACLGVLAVSSVAFWVQNQLNLSPRALFLSVGAGAIASPWSIVADYLVATGQARAYALTYIASAFATPIAALGWILSSGELQLALFIGGFAAAMVQAIAALLILRRIDRIRVNRKLFPVIARLWRPTLTSAMTEWSYSLIERWLVSSLLGLAAAGALFHSQQYKALANSGVKVLIRSTWSISIAEAKACPRTFNRSRIVWRMVDVGLITAAIAFLIVGRPFIDWLTNGKLGDAAPLVGAWMVVLLLYNLARPAVFVLHAFARSHKVGKISTIASIVTMASLFPCVYALGVWGPVVATIMGGVTNVTLLTLTDRAGRT